MRSGRAPTSAATTEVMKAVTLAESRAESQAATSAATNLASAPGWQFRRRTAAAAFAAFKIRPWLQKIECEFLLLRDTGGTLWSQARAAIFRFLATAF